MAEAGQRLWGGDDIDYLWAYAPTFDFTAEAALIGDELHGGSGGDWLEGQNGKDTLYGGEAIDMLVLDVSPNYTELGDTFDGHYGNSKPLDVRDENATDILLDDQIEIVSTGANKLDVSALTDRSNDWVGVIDGGYGSDVNPPCLLGRRPARLRQPHRRQCFCNDSRRRWIEHPDRFRRHRHARPLA